MASRSVVAPRARASLSSTSANKLIFELDDRRLKVVGNARDITTHGLYVVVDPRNYKNLILGSGTDSHVIRIVTSSLDSAQILQIDNMNMNGQDYYHILNGSGASGSMQGDPLVVYDAHADESRVYSSKVNYV